MLHSAKFTTSSHALQIRAPGPFHLKPCCCRRLGSTNAAAYASTASDSAAVHETLLRALEAPSPTASKLLAPLLSASLDLYLKHNRNVVNSIAALCQSNVTGHAGLQHDHYAYRTFGVPGLGIKSLAQVLEDMGYTLQEEGLMFPKKKLKAAWFAPPAPAQGAAQHLPRVFISEVEVHKLSKQAQSIIEEYAQSALGSSSSSSSVGGGSSGSSLEVLSNRARSARSIGRLGPAQVATAVTTGALPWKQPTKVHWDALAAESEYAAWVLVHGYALNHTALATHRMAPAGVALDQVTHTLASHGFTLNPDGGIIKTSPDGLLLQASTLSEQVPFHFSSEHGALPSAEPALIPGAYIEYVERRPLPAFAHKQEVPEQERREGFEIGNAERLFTSTTNRASSS